jgi:glycosyltransferase involved in cell wall biosynthesis
MDLPPVQSNVEMLAFHCAAAARAFASSRQPSRNRITVVIPAFNVEAYVAETCHAVAVNSRHIPLDVVVIDDGSTDRTAETARSVLEAANVPALIVSVPNAGLSAARNLGLDFVTTDYVAFLDADDLVGGDMYARLVSHADSEGCDQVFARSTAFRSGKFDDFPFFDTTAWDVILSGAPRRTLTPIYEPSIFLTEPKTCTRIWRTAFMREKQFRFPEGRIFEDIGVHLRALAACRRIGIVDIQGLLYRVGRSGALTAERGRKRFDALANISDALSSEDVRNVPPEVGAYVLISINRFLQWCRTSISLRMQKEFDREATRCLKLAPRGWFIQLTQVDWSVSKQVLHLLQRGMTTGELLRELPFLLSVLRKARKRRLTRHGWRALGHMHPRAEPHDGDRCQHSDYRHYGAYASMIPFDACAAFLCHSARNRAWRLSRLYPDATVHVLDGLNDEVSLLLAARPNIRRHAKAQEVAHTIRAEGGIIHFADLGRSVAATLPLLKDIPTDFISGELGVLDEGLDDLLTLVRRQVRRGFNFIREDGSRYAHAKREPGLPAVSVVVPIYNVEKYLDQCVASLSGQTLTDREIILVDDGATDGSAAMCDAWAAKDPTIRVIHKANGGCASARMAGLSEARGEWITFVDGDDWTEPDMLKRLLGLALQTGHDVVEGGWRLVFPSGQIDDRTQGEAAECHAEQGGLLWRLNHPAVVSQPTIWRRLYRTSFLTDQKIGFDSRLRRFDDMPFQFDALIRVGNIPFVDACFLNYRQNREGQDIGVTDDRLFIHFPILNLLRDSAIASGRKEIYRQFLEIQFHTHSWALTKVAGEFAGQYHRMVARDLFGPEQLGSSFESYLRLRRAFKDRRPEVNSLYWTYLTGARNETLPLIGETS